MPTTSHWRILTYLLLPAISQVHAALLAQSYGVSACAPTCRAPGSACDPEGLWNCLTHSWQRCAEGAWSVAMPCADGTVCAPAGLTDDLQIVGEDQYERDDELSSSLGLPSAHYRMYSAGGALARVHGGLALAAFLVYGWVIKG